MRWAVGPRLAAAGDLGRRYATVFGQAWRARKSLDAPERLPHEAQFLPAALELQETPVSPAPRAAMWLLIGFAAIAVLWAVFGRIDIVATARGKIVPSDRSKTIQPIETATVKAIRVADGQPVKAGEVLLELDATTADADRARYSNDFVSAAAQRERARAMLAAVSSGRAPVLERLPGVPVERQAQEKRIVDGQYDEYQARLVRIDADILRREAELVSTQQIVRKLEQTAPIARQRVQDFKDLVDKAFISKHGYLEKEQLRIEQEGDLATQRSRLKELAAAIAEVHRGSARRWSPKRGGWRSMPSTRRSRRPVPLARNSSRRNRAAG